jgi:hypothetical protein
VPSLARTALLGDASDLHVLVSVSAGGAGGVEGPPLITQNLTEEGPSGVEVRAGPAVGTTPYTFQHDEGGGRPGLPPGEHGGQGAGKATMAASMFRGFAQLWDSLGEQSALGMITASLVQRKGRAESCPDRIAWGRF